MIINFGWVNSGSPDTVFGYSLDGTHDTDDRWNLSPGNPSPGGITYGGGHFYVPDPSLDQTWAYDAITKTTVGAYDWDVSFNSPSGIAYVEITTESVPASAKLYGYTGAGLRTSSNDLDLTSK